MRKTEVGRLNYLFPLDLLTFISLYDRLAGKIILSRKMILENDFLLNTSSHSTVCFKSKKYTREIFSLHIEHDF